MDADLPEKHTSFICGRTNEEQTRQRVSMDPIRDRCRSFLLCLLISEAGKKTSNNS